MSEAYDDYVAVSVELAALLDAGTTARTDGQIETLQARKDRLELELVERVPGLGDSMRSLHVPLTDLQKALADHEVLVDFVRYRGRESDGGYAVFVVSTSGVRRYDVDNVPDLERKIHEWRESIARQGDLLSGELYGLLWRPLEKFVPSRTATVYICPDGALCLVPWSALKRSDGHVLLERYAIALLPYPQYLLRRAGTSSRASGGRVLTVGNIDYGEPPEADGESTSAASVWQSLRHSGVELEELKSRAEAAGARVLLLDGRHATTENVLAELPRTTWAHFATHGFFSGELGPATSAGSRRTSPLDRNPLVSSGLVLANANLSGGRLTGAAVCNLDLRKTDLVFLSACDTGVGNVFDGEGVFGLQRAFHVAGTRNVVCSLWKVDDAATALMVRMFYKRYWTDGLSALEALRRTQLDIYRNPLLVEEFGESRGLRKIKPRKSIPRSAPTSPPVFWAGFVFSGVEPLR